VCNLRHGDTGVRSRAWGLGYAFRGQGSGFRVQGSGSEVYNLEVGV
jgi:hypothetical protein